MELVTGSGELNKTRFQEALLKQELGGLRYIGQIRLGGSLANPCIPIDCLMDRFLLRGWRRDFLPSSSVSFSITHRRVICVYNLSSLLLFISFLLLCCFKYGLEQLSCLYACVYTIPHLVLSQCKINQVVTLIWGPKQLVCFRHISKLSSQILKVLITFWKF